MNIDSEIREHPRTRHWVPNLDQLEKESGADVAIERSTSISKDDWLRCVLYCINIIWQESRQQRQSDNLLVGQQELLTKYQSVLNPEVNIFVEARAVQSRTTYCSDATFFGPIVWKRWSLYRAAERLFHKEGACIDLFSMPVGRMLKYLVVHLSLK